MDLAYDHIAEKTYANDRSQTPKPGEPDKSTDTASAQPPKPNLQTEFQETFKAFSSSAWGAKLGGFWGNVRKQGESYYEEARKEVGDLGADALKWSEGIREKATSTVNAGVSRGRSDTVKATDSPSTTAKAEEGEDIGTGDTTLQENETFIERFRAEAARRLKEVQKAEDAADEALLRFGTNIRNFLKDAVSVSAPEAIKGNNAREVIFESKDALTGKRVIHTSRFDAQLHVIHTTMSSFTQDPEIGDKEWEDWKKGFDIDQKTDAVAKNLDKHPELRNAMEQLVPQTVEYKDFWMRYYFLRHVVEAQEEKRREMLKASAGNDEEEVGWDDDDSDEEAEKDSGTALSEEVKVIDTKANGSTSTLQPPPTSNTDHLKPAEPRRSHDEKSVADSDASYDLVSGATSRAPGSPREAKAKVEEESDEEDWE